MNDRLDSIRAALSGRYQIERLLGEGGMATVYLAQDERHHRSVAVKVLHPELARALGVERFGREIGIAARLSHPNIVPLLDSGTVSLDPGAPATPFYVMPLVEGESLRNRLIRTQRLPLEEALRLAREVAGALDYAHRNGVVHRDIKPENILFADGHAVVADFGLARALGESASATLTQAGQALGTPQYMSPEQITGDTVPDGRTDIYSLACVLFEMLTGKPPGDGNSVQALLARRLSAPPPSIRVGHPEVPEAVEVVLLRAMAIDPAHRYATAGEFATALSDPAGSGAREALPRSRRNLVVAALLGAAAVVFALTRLARPGFSDAITSIAIAPEPGDTATAYLSEGVQEAVADLLRRLPRLRVTALSLVAQIQRQEPALNAEELGRRLQVGAVLTWALRRIPDSVQVRAELFRVPGGSLVWSARFSRPFADMAGIQGEIARAISDSLRLELSDRERATMDRRPTAKAEAYDYYLRGRHFGLVAIVQGTRNAEALLDSAQYYAARALQVDSTFGLAVALLASWQFTGSVRGWRKPFGEHVDSGLALARRALALDSTGGEAWLTLVANSLYLSDDFVGLESMFRAALRLAPTSPSVWNFYAIYLGEVENRLDAGIAAAHKAIELEPTIQFANTLGDLYMRRRFYDSAIVVLQRAVTQDPAAVGPQLRLVTSYERTGRYAEAVVARRAWQGEAASAPFAQGLGARGAAGYRAALDAGIRARIDSLERQVGGPRVYPRDTLPSIPETRIALLYGQLGEWSRAVDWIIKEHALRPKRLVLWIHHPDMQGVWSDPRFVALARGAGFSAR